MSLMTSLLADALQDTFLFPIIPFPQIVFFFFSHKAKVTMSYEWM